MSKKLFVLMAFAGFLLASQASWAVAVAVGTCRPSLVSYTTIQDAVNHVAPGSTVYVCPGTYPEQVDISKSLILTGVSFGHQDAPIITSPAGGMVATTNTIYTGTPTAPQIWVHGTAGVTISNLTVDGANNGSACTFSPVGIMYEDAAGTVSHVVVRNEIESPYDVNGGCQGGYGIFVQSDFPTNTAALTVTGSTVHDFQKNGIVAQQVGSTLTASGNTVLGLGPTTGAAQNGIEIAFGAAGKATGNSVADFVYSPGTAAASGILVFASPNVTISGNSVANAQYGISTNGTSGGNGDFTIITSNKVFGSHLFDGIDVCSNNNTVKTNTVTSSDESGIHNDSTCVGPNVNNTISGNTINESCAGILTGTAPAGANVLTPNTFFNVINTLFPGDSCTSPVFNTNLAAVSGSRHLPVQP